MDYWILVEKNMNIWKLSTLEKRFNVNVGHLVAADAAADDADDDVNVNVVSAIIVPDIFLIVIIRSLNTN